MIGTHYTAPADLPTISLVAKGGCLILLDWHCDKTERLFTKINQKAMWLDADVLDVADSNQAVLLNVIAQLDEYFQGVRTQFDIPLDVSFGTPFEQLVWRALQQIPYGQTISYATLASNIGKPTAFRAVANANGKNPISIIIPCHRVIASDGRLGGYTGGVDIKKQLLNLENVLVDC